MKLLPILSITALALVSCDKKQDGTKDPNNNADLPAASPDALASLVLAEAPEGAISITQARQEPAAGEEIVVSGDIIGRQEVFVPNRAMLILGDPEVITSCNRMPDDHCPTPWDVCCDDPETISNSIATIQVLDSDGQLVKTGLKGLGGMKELSQLVVKGTVDPSSGPKNLVINASGIHVASVEPNNSPKPN